MRYVVQVSVKEKPQRYAGLYGLLGGSSFVRSFFQQIEVNLYYLSAINQRFARYHC